MSHPPGQRRELGAGAWIDLWPGLVPDPDGRWLARLRDELPLAAERYRFAGRAVLSPRLVSWHGDPEAGYSYSGVWHEPVPWTSSLRELRRRVEEVTGLSFNAVLANFYRHGGDSIGWHADAEPAIGPTPDDRWVASLSFGHPRRFVLRHRNRKSDRHELSLGGGTLLVMRGTTQTHYRHAAPKTRLPVGPRLSLTFRHVV